MTTIRLQKVAHGHGLRERFVLGLMRVLGGGRPAPDVVRTLLYRRDYQLEYDISPVVDLRQRLAERWKRTGRCRCRLPLQRRW